jgi:hypothetical protein
LSSLSLRGLREEYGVVRELKIYLSEEMNERFRKAAMEAFGYGRGSISKAAEEAALEWCERRGLSKAAAPETPSLVTEKETPATTSMDGPPAEKGNERNAVQT